MTGVWRTRSRFWQTVNFKTYRQIDEVGLSKRVATKGTPNVPSKDSSEGKLGDSSRSDVFNQAGRFKLGACPTNLGNLRGGVPAGKSMQGWVLTRIMLSDSTYLAKVMLGNPRKVKLRDPSRNGANEGKTCRFNVSRERTAQ